MKEQSLPGVYQAVKKSGETYYRSSFTFRGRHISLGSFNTQRKAHKAYREALEVIRSDAGIPDYDPKRTLPFEKYVSIVNFRDNDVYFSNPIYLKKRFFEYYFTKTLSYKFDVEDLFYYAEHKISRRGNHLFVADWGTQVNLLSRYGIKSHGVKGRDFIFINGDDTDYRYENIEVINPYYGVARVRKNQKILYKASILINGRVVIGYYDDIISAAIAYNKTADLLKGVRDYRQNYIESLSAKEYAEIYSGIAIPDRIFQYVNKC